MYDQPEKLKALLERCQSDARQNTARKARDRADLLSLTMNRGGEDNQWLVWDSGSDRYVRRPDDGDAGLPEWFFRASSNFLANKIDGITAIQNQSQPSKTWYATKDDDSSRAAADVCELADPVLLDELDYPHLLRPRLNKLVALTNLAALVVTYDNDPKWGMEGIPLLLCQNADCRQIVQPADAPNPEDMCPDCGGALDFSPDPRDPSGTTPLQMMQPKGRIDGELLSSFELSLPKSAQMAHEERVPWVCSHQRWSSEAAISRWPKLKGVVRVGRGGAAGSAKATEQGYADQMRNLSAPVQDGHGGVNQADGPIIWRLWHDPIDDDDFCFPQGVFLTVLEGENTVLDSGPLPFTDDEGRPFKNILIRQYAPSPGTAFGKPPADDLVPLQKQLNLAQSLAFLILMHHASPRTFIPSTVTLHDKLTGVPGKDVGYRALVPGDKPTVEPGAGFPSSLQWFLEFIIQTFDTVSKLNAVLMGERPQGDPTLGEVEILQERGFAAFQEPLEQLVAFERRLSMKLIWIAKECAWSPRFRQILSDENGEWELKQFIGADLEGHVTCEIELASAWPKSPMLTNLRINKAIELGMLNPQDPEVKEAYLRLNDLQDFTNSASADQQQLARQLDVWKDAQTPQQIEPPQKWWNLAYHVYRKTQFLKSEQFEQLRTQRAQVAAAMVQHVTQLQMMLQPPAPPTNPVKGANGALARATANGVLRPVGKPAAKGAAGALRGATAAGVIRPAGTGLAMARHKRSLGGGAKNALLHRGVLKPARPHVPPPVPGGGGVPGSAGAGNPGGAQA